MMAMEYKLPSMPPWLIENRMKNLFASGEGDDASSEMMNEATIMVKMLAPLELRLLGQQVTCATNESEHDLSGSYLVCLARLLLGACCEAFASIQCTMLCREGEKPHKCVVDRVCQLYHDASMAACWTSAHAQHIHQIQSRGWAISWPSIHSVPCEPAEMDLSDLYAHRVSMRGIHSSDAVHLLSLLSRCTNPGTRGWDSAVIHAIDKSEGVRRICSNGFSIVLLGMHGHIHPSLRMHWTKRLALSNMLSSMLGTSSFSGVISKCMVQFKESMRRMLTNCTASAHAYVQAMRIVEHPLAHLQSVPFCMPCVGLEGACGAFARAGVAIVDAKGDVEIAKCVRTWFDIQAKALNTQSCNQSPNRIVWNQSYLGKGTGSVHYKVAAIRVAQEVWSAAFQCNFIPFWVHSAGHRLRASRLDPVQYKSIHKLNAATELTLLLSDEDALSLQRKALNTPSSGVMTLEEVARFIGVPDVRGSSCNGGSKGSVDAACVIGRAGPKNAARLLSFCRAAWVSELLLVYDLGKATARQQTSALLRRMVLHETTGPIPEDADPLDYLHLVPEHARNMHACMQCKRVANAMVCDSRSECKTCFNEIGTSMCMMSTCTITGATQLRCAKRSSASLRTAVAFEDEMSLRAVECDENDKIALESMIVDTSTGKESGAAARVRRDSKKALEQRVSSVSCGAEVMLSTPIVGKVIRIWGDWYSLCCFCGCFVRFYPNNRAGSQICCTRCDYTMLYRSEKPATTASCTTAEAPRCRFCSKRDPMRTGSRWHMVKAPTDATGPNANLPPPLRTVYFCPQHFRHWIPACIKTMPMRVIFSHIVYGARPCYGNVNHTDVDTEGKLDKRIAKRRRPLLKFNKKATS